LKAARRTNTAALVTAFVSLALLAGGITVLLTRDSKHSPAPAVSTTLPVTTPQP
jgi:hypothetical protein